jgi:hypothetical protein
VAGSVRRGCESREPAGGPPANEGGAKNHPDERHRQIQSQQQRGSAKRLLVTEGQPLAFSVELARHPQRRSLSKKLGFVRPVFGPKPE